MKIDYLKSLVKELCSLPKETEWVEFKHKKDRIRAIYQHACLFYVQRDYMTNSSLRKRFAIDVKNSSMVSRIIKNADADSESRRYARYVPFWA